MEAKDSTDSALCLIRSKKAEGKTSQDHVVGVLGILVVMNLLGIVSIWSKMMHIFPHVVVWGVCSGGVAFFVGGRVRKWGADCQSVYRIVLERGKRVLVVWGWVVTGCRSHLKFWWNRNKHSYPHLTKVKDWGGFRLKQVIGLGLILALILSFGYLQVGGTIEIWRVSCLWFGLSLWIWLLKRLYVSRREVTGRLYGLGGVIQSLKLVCVLSSIVVIVTG